MTRTKAESQASQFMEVSGIDPAIVREEQQAVERANSSKSTVPDMSALHQAVNLNKLQSQQLPQQYSQADSQQLFGADATGGADDVRYHTQQMQGHGVHQQHTQYPYLHQQHGSSSSGQARSDGSGGIASRTNPVTDQSQVQHNGLINALTDRLSSPPAGTRMGKRRVRLGWTDEETRNLMEGCKRHGVGNWKKILTDPSFEFNCRTAVDLKDRFRTSFPEEYSRLYPNARTHKTKRQGSTADVSPLVKINRKERRSFTPAEDERLLQGFLKHGPAWSKIQRDPALNLSERRSTDLRDRFRNAFPERYTAAGYKGRATPKGQTSLQSASELAASATQMSGQMNVNVLDDDVHLQQHGMMPSRSYMPNAQTVQHPLQLQGIGYQSPAVYFGHHQNFYRQSHNSQNTQP